MQDIPLKLRAVEPSDLPFLFEVENDETLLDTGYARIPFSKNTLETYLSQPHDIYADKQLRLIAAIDGKACAVLDFYDFDAFHQRCMIGIMVHPQFRKVGIGYKALVLGLDFAGKNLGLKNVGAFIGKKNKTSVRLFKKALFKKVGAFNKYHRLTDGSYDDLLIYQKSI